MTRLFAKYGKIALALAAIFLSGQVIGWMLALHSCEARPEVPADPQRWSDQMMIRLHDDLGLTADQSPAVRAKLESVSARMKQKRDSALFQIHLELIKLHDDLSPELSPGQREKLARSRRKLVQSTGEKFPELMRDTAMPPATGDPSTNLHPQP
jgi:hypothetical protein